MASHTPNLDLLKKDPVTDGSETFNIETMLNDNWDKIDAAMGQVQEELADIDLPLSDATNGTRSDVAASEKAVGQVMSAAQAAQTTANAANTAAAAANNSLGPLSSLLTTSKGNTVAAINELFTSASNGKTQVAAAITGKGVPASGSDTFPVLAGKIGQIVTGKRYAEGTANARIDVGLQVTGLGFKPSTVVFSRAEADGNDHKIQGIIKNYLHEHMEDNPYGYVTLIDEISNSPWYPTVKYPTVIHKTGNVSNQYLFQGGFSTGSFIYTLGKMKWRAYE